MFSPAIQRLLKYTSIGVGTFAFDLALLFVLIDLLQINYLLAAAAAFAIAVSVNYLISRHFVFRGTLRGVGSGYLNFMFIAGTGLLVVVGGMYVLVDVLSLHYLISRVSIAGLAGLWNYLMNLYVNFKVVGQH